MDIDRLSPILSEFLHYRQSDPVFFYLGVVALSAFALLLPIELIFEIIGLTPSVLQHNDFSTYYATAEAMLNGEPIYTEGVVRRYLYPPITVVFFVPFTTLPLPVAAVLWDVLGLAIFVAGALFLLRSYRPDLTIVEMIAVGWFVVGFGPVIVVLQRSQITTFLAGFLCVAAGFLERERADSGTVDWSGVATAITSFPKLFYATSGAFLLRNRKRLLSGVVAGVALWLVSLGIFGVETHISYLEALATPNKFRPNPIKKWQRGFYPFYVLGSLERYARVLAILGVISLTMLTRKVSDVRIDREVFALGLLLVPLVNSTGDVLTLTLGIPIVVPVLVNELSSPDGHPVVPLTALLLIHVHTYATAALCCFVPRQIPIFAAFRPIIPFAQPALIALAGLYLFLSYQIFEAR